MNKKPHHKTDQQKPYEFCEVCKLNHNQNRRRHTFLPNHKSKLSTLLTRFQSKLSDLKPFLKTPILAPRPHHALRLWCVFCDSDILELDTRFARGNAIEHLSSDEHWKRVKAFMWRHGGGMDRVDLFRFTQDDYVKWEKKCKLLEIEAAKLESVGASNNIHNEMNADNVVNSFQQNNVDSVNFSNVINGVLPLHNSYTNERTQVFCSALPSVSEAGPSCYNVPGGAQVADAQAAGCVDNQNSSNGYLNNGYVRSGIRIANGESRLLSMGSLTKISSTSQQAIEGNVHTGAPPPWFDAAKESQLDLTCTPRVSDPGSSKAGKSTKLNPKRVGAAWAERRKLEMELERRGEAVNNNFDANWLPNFGRVWQSGTRKESRKEFQMEKKSSSKPDNQAAELMPLQPYVSKRMRKDTSE